MINVKKKLLAAFFSCVTMGLAASPSQALRVHLSSGDVQTFVLSDAPVATFTENEFVITTKDVVVKYYMIDVTHADFVDAEAGVDEIVDGGIKIDLSNPEVISISGATAGEDASVYDMTGISIARATVAGDGCVSLSLSNFRKGTYILLINQSSLKFIKR